MTARGHLRGSLRRVGPAAYVAAALRFLIVAAGMIVSVGGQELPSAPDEGQFLHDYADVLSDADEESLRSLQEEIFQTHGTPLVVVTVERMRDYVGQAPSIGAFARMWFDHWGIGTADKNDGILVLISVQDRQGRIELGADWGQAWNDYCQNVMDEEMIPHFKQGDYGPGLLEGAKALAQMAAAGPDSEPPEPGLIEKFKSSPVGELASEKNPIAGQLGGWAIPLMIVAGIGCIIASFFFPAHRKTLLIIGGGLLAMALCFWVVMVVLAIFLRSRGGGGSGGGGFGGGFSGGGGASGSW